jgi:repressor LexA
MPNLTTKQQRILDFIETYIDQNGNSPSLFDIQKFLGVRALSTVHQHIRSLEAKGLLSRDRNSARGINYIMNAGRFIGELIRVPMVGTIIAGYPIEAVEEVEFYLQLPSTTLQKNVEYYALKVKGDSMIDSYIMEGDLVVVEKRSTPKRGEMVVALTGNGDATLKHFYDEGAQVRLQPANPRYQPLIYPKGEVQVQGVVVKVIRDIKI